MNTMRTIRNAPFFARLRTGVLLGLGLLAAAVAAPGARASDTAAASATTEAVQVTAIFAKALHVGDGTTLENGLIVIRDGTIAAITASGSAPAGATVIRMDEAHITPGLIDANARLEPRDLVAANARAAGRTPLAQLLDCGIHDSSACSCNGASICQLSHVHDQFEGEGDAVCPVCGYPAPPGIADLIAGVQSGGSTPTESSSEVVPHTFVADALNLRSADLERLAAEGVTTVYASPDNAAVIGPRGAIIRTAGPVRDRLVVEAAAVHATMGSDSFRVGGGNSPPFRQFVGVNTRRPGSRMGVAWVFRKAMYDTINDARGFEIGGADTPPEAALPVLAEVLQGEVPIRFAARAQRDIEGAFRLAKEFGLSFTLVEGIEAHTTLEMLTDSNTSVVFGPISMDRGGFRNEADTRFTTAKDLLAAGVRTALSAMDRREEDGLGRQAMYAMKSGVSFEDALRAVTLTPAEILGIDGDTGSLTVGKRADLVIWSGEPFAATSRPMMVMVGGEVALDRRETTD